MMYGNSVYCMSIDAKDAETNKENTAEKKSANHKL